MFTTLRKITRIPSKANTVVLTHSVKTLDDKRFTREEISYVKHQHEKKKQSVFCFNRFDHAVFVVLTDLTGDENVRREKLRRAGSKLVPQFTQLNIAAAVILNDSGHGDLSLALAEGIALANYRFDKYKSKVENPASLKSIEIHDYQVAEKQIAELQIIVNGALHARNLVNEPVAYLSASQLSREFEKLGRQSGFKVEVLNKSKIQALKMGGLLAVNKGSVEPPTFSILEYKPKNAKNKKPYVLVGKGVVYDTGGYNIKVANGMETMKCDMAGAAAVAGALFAVAANKLPIHVIGLVPATDNRIDGKAYVAGDIITMHNGVTVEVLNTDAEGRLILGDALSYAKKYKPELVIDLATLTGAAMVAIGKYGIVAMGTAGEKVREKLRSSGSRTHERLAEFPFWDEYGDLVKSDIADIKNIGGPVAGAITAGKFLEHFTDYPWMHFDIAGPAFLDGPDGYHTKGGTGVGVRLLYDFFKNLSSGK